MRVAHEEAAKKFVLYADDGEKAGEIEYKYGGNKDLYATGTEVYPAYEGHGYARTLLDALADWAREGGYKIVPICTYVINAFAKYPEKYADVIKR